MSFPIGWSVYHENEKISLILGHYTKNELRASYLLGIRKNTIITKKDS